MSRLQKHKTISRVSSSWEPNKGQPLNPSVQYFYDERAVPMMPRGTHLSDGFTPDSCYKLNLNNV